MAQALFLDEAEAARLRSEHYNAEVVGLRKVHSDLWVYRVRPDAPLGNFHAGQYTSLGLGHWEPRAPGTQPEELSEEQYRKVVKRAYSISCPILDETGGIVRVDEGPELEFYITLVRSTDKDPPALTPRLFLLDVGSRLWIGRKVTGHYTLAPVKPDDDVIFIATGTGEAPHNAMLAELLARGHRGRLVSIVCVRTRADLGYVDTHRRLEERFDQYQFLSLTTREPENLDPSVPHYVGKIYLQDYVAKGQFERETGLKLDPARTHVFLCGNPSMIGLPQKVTGAGGEAELKYPATRGMVEVLAERGFVLDSRGVVGQIHYEEYW
ncbi:MAG: ferredoxin--NADP reductase [Pirellulales bacterium]|nr:ferredoxin--NADP reductase [Pirellulales bacterium]